MKKNVIPLGLGILAISMIATAATNAASNTEEGERPQRRGNFAERNPEMEAQREAMHEALEAGDYQAWLEIVSQNENSPFADFSEDQFNRLQQVHDLHEEGDHEEARELAEELGLERRGHMKKGHEGMKAMHEALEAGDYDAWLELVSQKENSPFADFTEEDFNQLQKIHEFHQSGDHEGAKELAEELGLERPERGERGEEGKRRPFSEFDQDVRQAIHEAIESGDYETFSSLVEGSELAEKIDEAKFQEMIERHQNKPERPQRPIEA